LKKEDNKYLKAVHSQVLQDVVLRLDKSLSIIFRWTIEISKVQEEKQAGTTHLHTLRMKEGSSY